MDKGMSVKMSEQDRLDLHAAFPCYLEPTMHWKPHAHSHHELVLIQQGQHLSRVHGKERFSGPGDILLYKAGTVHEEWIVDDAPVLTWSCQFYGDCFGPSEPVFRHDIHGRMQTLLAKLFYCYIQNELFNGFSSHFSPLLQQIVDELQRLPSRDSDTLVDQVRAFVRARISEEFSVDSLARYIGLSRAYFARRYRFLTGRTPMEDVRFLRVEEACRLLATTQLPLHEVAPMVGIASVNHLSRLIKANFGMGVREVRNASREPHPLTDCSDLPGRPT